jgi:3-oxoadipate enol-lactonase
VTQLARVDGAGFATTGPAGRLVGAALGSGPTVAFVHGVNMTRQVWDEVIAALPGRRRICFDLRGHGESVYGGPFSIDDYVSDLVAVMATVPAARAHLVGVSLGGMIACRFAQLSPDRVASVVTFGSGLAVRHADLDGGMRRLSEVGAQAYFAASLPRNSLPRDASPAMAEKALAMATHGRSDHTEMVVELTRAAFTTDLTGVLGPLGVPALVVNGEDDRTCSPIAGAELAAAIGADLLEVAGTGHLLPLECPKFCAGLISGMIEPARNR